MKFNREKWFVDSHMLRSVIDFSNNRTNMSVRRFTLASLLKHHRARALRALGLLLADGTPTVGRQVLRLTQKVRREYEPPESAQLNFGAIFHGKFLLWLPCWAHIWILQHINSVFLMRNRSHIQNSQRNHLPSLFLQFGTLSIKWISHIR